MGREPQANPDDAVAAAGGDAGDPRALDGWVLSTLPRAIAFAAGLLKDRAQAEDVVHDCYCRLLAKSGEYDLRRDGAKLLFRSITNACIDRSRKRPTLSLYEPGRGDGDDGPGRLRDLADLRTPEPWRRAEHGELQRAVSAALEQLPATQRAAVELKGLGHSLQEIADALGVTPTNAGVLIHRGRQAMARHVDAYMDT